jgi:8-oxo-dGTP diphosphatase
MEEEKKYYYDYLLKVLSIAKIGLVYSKDEYALQNYKDIQDITEKALENFENMSFDRPNYFQRKVYPTPNVSCRTIISNEKGEVLMVKEAVDGGYSFPGGWCDLFDSPSEAAARECKEEAGCEVVIDGIIAILNRTPFKNPTSVPEYAIFFKGHILNNLHQHDHEILNVGFFDIDNLPLLSRKITKSEIVKVLEAFRNNKIIFD